jgi:hypothetical protein
MSFTLLPPDLKEHVTLLVTNSWFDTLTPRRAGSTENPCFAVNEETFRVPAVERRHVAVPIPDALREVYARYPIDTEFSTAHGWTFLSEDELKRRWEAMPMVGEGRRSMVDLAIAYAGMGHVTVLSYDPITDGVFTGLDGGANGWDREANHRTRIGRDVNTLVTTPLETWWKEEVLATSTKFLPW